MIFHTYTISKKKVKPKYQQLNFVSLFSLIWHGTKEHSLT